MQRGPLDVLNPFSSDISIFSTPPSIFGTLVLFLVTNFLSLVSVLPAQFRVLFEAAATQ